MAHQQAFDPWGRRRNPVTWETDDNALPPGAMRLWLRGFTGHEHLDDFGLINMNARLYDPKLGRMLSPDVLVGAPNSPLGYNRYVYALNNPISNIDPTGNDPVTLSAILIGAAIGAAVAGTTYTLQTTTMQGGLQKNWNIGEFLKSTAIGAASGAVSGAIGSAFGATGTIANELGRATMHGGVGAFFSGVQGGDPLMGFVTSFLSTGISHGLEGSGAAALTSGVGGAAFNAGMGAAFSAAQGGDPWIGAAGSLIGYLANQSMAQARQKAYLRRAAKAMELTLRWASGIHGEYEVFKNDDIAYSFQDSRVVNEARAYWYSEVNAGRKTIHDGLYNFAGTRRFGGTNFGPSGYVAAGLDPMEQFVGSFSVGIRSDGKYLHYILANTTSWKSLFAGIGSNNYKGTIGGNYTQVYIFKEPIKFSTK